MFVRMDGENKRLIVVKSEYLNAEIEFDCINNEIKLISGSCGIAKPEPLKEQKPKKTIKTKTLNRSASDIAKGIIGIAKAELGINRVEEVDLESRWLSCKKCEHNQYGFCGAKKEKTGKACGCRICDMIKNKKASCPIDAWNS